MFPSHARRPWTRWAAFAGPMQAVLDTHLREGPRTVSRRRRRPLTTHGPPPTRDHREAAALRPPHLRGADLLHGRGHEQGKKLSWRDGVAALSVLSRIHVFRSPIGAMRRAAADHGRAEGAQVEQHAFLAARQPRLAG